MKPHRVERNPHPQPGAARGARLAERLDPPAGLAALAQPFCRARIASESGANSGRKRRMLLDRVPADSRSPCSLIHAAIRLTGRKQA